MKKLLCLMLALCMLISCASAEETLEDGELSEIDAFIEATENGETTEIEAFADTEEVTYDPDAIVVSFDGGSITLGEAMDVYNTRSAYYLEMGYTEDEYAEDLKADVLSNMAEDAILVLKAKEMGVYELSEDEIAECETEASDYMSDYIEYYKDYFTDEDLSDEEIEASTSEYLAASGITYDSILEELEESVWKQKLYDIVTADVTVSDDDVKALYDTGIEEAKTNYADDESLYEYEYAYGETIYYNPEGYRLIGIGVIPFNDEEAENYSSLADELDTADETRAAEINDELDAIFNSVADRNAELISRAAAGEDLETLFTEYGLADYYFTAPMKTGSDIFTEEWVDAAMALQLGANSEVIPDSEGLNIMRYISDITPGEVPYDDIKDALRESALSEAADNAYNAAVDAWLEEANIVTYPELIP